MYQNKYIYKTETIYTKLKSQMILTPFLPLVGSGRHRRDGIAAASTVIDEHTLRVALTQPRSGQLKCY